MKAAWIEEAKNVDGTEVRDVHRMRILYCYRLAVNMVGALRDAEGNPVLTADSEPIMVPMPDLRSAARFLDLAAKLDGLNEQRVVDNGGKDLITMMKEASLASTKAGFLSLQ